MSDTELESNSLMEQMREKHQGKAVRELPEDSPTLSDILPPQSELKQQVDARTQDPQYQGMHTQTIIRQLTPESTSSPTEQQRQSLLKRVRQILFGH